MDKKKLERGSDCYHCPALFFCMSKASGRVPKDICDKLWERFLQRIPPERNKEEA